jgi:hypothetical protein
MSLSTYQIKLAMELAESMRDVHSILRYYKWVEKYPEEVLRGFQVQILARSDINNRGGYFTTLVKQHEFKKKHYGRH